MLYSIIKYLSIYLSPLLLPLERSIQGTTPLVLEKKNQYFENISEIIYGSNFTLLS